MQSERMELLESLKLCLAEGALSIKEFPRQSVIDIIQEEYNCLLEELVCQFREYLYIYDILMKIEMRKGRNCFQLSVLLGELISDLKRMPTVASDRLVGLRETRDRVITEFCIQRSKEVYEHYSWKTVSGETAFKGRGVIYTAITGGYDELQEPVYVNPEFDYICFTDNRSLNSKVWNIRYIENPEGVDNIRLARMYKILCHEFLKEYDFSIYVDGKIQIVGDLNAYIKTYSMGSPMLCFPHSVRECAYEEAKICLEVAKDDPEKITSQMEGYEKEGYPVNNGLIDSACLVRQHNDKTLQEVMVCWWKEVKEKSRRDQLSIGYVCWKNNFHYDLSDLFIYQNIYICKKRSWELPY